MFSNIDVYELSSLLGSINIIDLRSIEKYNTSHINTSINIPFNILINNPSKYLKKEEKYYLYCQSGITSTKVCKLLSISGYKVINVLGGYEAWLLR